MVSTYVDESPIQSQVIDAIWVGPWYGWIREVMPIDSGSVLHFTPLPTLVVEVSNQLLLLGVDGYDWIPTGYSLANLVVDVSELFVAVGMVVTLFGLPVPLKAIIHGAK